MVFITKFVRIGLQAARQLSATPLAAVHGRAFHLTSLLAKERRYTNKHEWVELVSGNNAIVGISSYAQEALGDVVFAQLPEPGTELKQDDECGALESVKAASEVFAPVSGKVTEKKRPGWLFKVDLKNPQELDALMTEEQYKTFVSSSGDH
ncbi:hypothetical protein M5D96_006413 [Drosophila gunungcola]|uniref:Glycine cleavage system H protein, mitochondrial n=1 Tax=Drosophila gunungcola TaxID=103775 RepID=A0A9P9YPF2_9MUSC|nr:hypothetical protein M5D96_006413 [Drosophila gunungcola]